MSDPSPLEQAAQLFVDVCDTYDMNAGYLALCRFCGKRSEVHQLKPVFTSLRLSLEARTQERDEWQALACKVRDAKWDALFAAKDAAEAKVQALDYESEKWHDAYQGEKEQLHQLHAALQGLAQRWRDEAMQVGPERDDPRWVGAQYRQLVCADDLLHALEALVRPTEPQKDR